MTEIINIAPQKRKQPTPKSKPQKGDQRGVHSQQYNGSALLPGVDGRSGWVRRAKELIDSHAAALGGVDNVSPAESALVRRSAVLIVELERLERIFALAGQADADSLDLYARVAGNLRRLLEAVGLQRRSRDVTSFTDIVRADLEQVNKEQVRNLDEESHVQRVVSSEDAS
jgi:hypothetical protein